MDSVMITGRELLRLSHVSPVVVSGTSQTN